MKEQIEFESRVAILISRISIYLLGTIFRIKLDHFRDSLGKPSKNPRLFIQIVYDSWNNHSHVPDYKEWKGRKWDISRYMTDDEIIKTCYAAYKMAVEHEVAETFRVDGKDLFNHHIDFEELIKISDKEVKRK